MTPVTQDISLRLAGALTALLLVAPACSDDSDSPQEQSIVDIAVADSNFSILVAALQKADLVDTLDGAGPFTVFAPTDAAFAASGITSLDDFSAEQLQTILLYHVVSGAAVDSASISAGPIDTAAALTAFVGTSGGVTLNGGSEQAGGAEVSSPDIAADNGIIHVIDRVLLPPDIAACAVYGGLDSLVGAVTAASDITEGVSVLDALQSEGPFTVFAPTNDAFAAIDTPADTDVLRDILLYHVLGANVLSNAIPGQADSLLQNQWGNGVSMLFDSSAGVKVNGSEVAIADIKCTNGTVHVINDVLLPPNVVDMATIAGFTSLVGAVGAASDIPNGPSVAAALAADAPYTVFAPTNEAFGAITVPSDSDVLRDVLLLHVVQAAAPVLSSGLPASADSLLGTELSFDTSGPSVSSPGTAASGIVLTDLHVTNGVIHVIDKVLLP